MRPGESLESLSREQLLELLSIYSKNWQAMDGVWFQSVEGKYGMEEAMYHDVEAWKRFTVTEARRIKKFLNLPEYPGLEGLEQALQFRFYANLSHYQLIRQGDTLLYRVLECRVQQARTIENARYLLENGSICPENVVGQNSIVTGSGVYTSYQDPILGTTVYFCYL